MSKWSLVGNSYERPLGDSEFAFFPASQNALGDMFLHLGFRAPREFIQEDHVRKAWAIIRRRHPMLMSKVVVDNDVNSARFSFTPPTSGYKDSLNEAGAALHFKHESKDELISNYMNGPRILSNNYLSYLVISSPPAVDDDASEIECDLLMCAPHFIGDGIALHRSTHDLICLLTSKLKDKDVQNFLEAPRQWETVLPLAFETQLSGPKSLLGKAAAKINFIQTMGKEIGGHSFSRIQRGQPHTALIEHAFSESQTSAILAHCKTNGVTVNHALSALCSVAWAKIATQSKELPMMMYTAANLRPHISLPDDFTYWNLALTYFNIVLPAFLPASPAVFWHRARQAKTQTRNTLSSPFLVSRALHMASTRGSRARGTPQALPQPVEAIVAPAPSTALLGLSMVGRLDDIYKRKEYPDSIQLHSVTTASRLKPGGMLLLEHTFGNKLWLHLCWDEMGFQEGQVESFWECLKDAVVEYLC